jgi:hypothetical protein
MRGARSLIVLLVIAAGLGAYIYFVEAKKDLSDPALKRDKVFAIAPGKIDQVTVTATGGDVTTLKKSGDAWQVVAPVTAPADASAASSIVSTLETLEMNKSLGDQTTSLANFGLDPPRYRVAFRAEGDAAEHVLNVGNKTPTGSDLYAQVAGKPTLFLLSAYLDDNLNRTTFDLRDKTVLKFARDDVDAISLQPAGAPAIVIAKKDVDWVMQSPVEARLDPMAIDTLLSRAGSIQAKSIVGDGAQAPTAAELKKYGLDTPQLTVTVGAGSTRASLAIGGHREDGTLYARDLSRPLVYTIEAAALTDLDKKPDDLRVKDIFTFKSYDALGLEITSGGTTAAFEKTAGAAGADGTPSDVWKQTKPEARDANQTAMTDLLNTLSSLRADSFLAKAAASGEDIAVVARFGDRAKPKEERVTLRKSGATAQAIRDGVPGAAAIPTADFDKALTQLKALTGGK